MSELLTLNEVACRHYGEPVVIVWDSEVEGWHVQFEDGAKASFDWAGIPVFGPKEPA